MRQFVLAVVITVLPLTGVLAQPAKQKPSSPPSQDHTMMLMDAEFAYLAAKHHRGGIEMTRLEESRGTSASVKALAAKIRQGQERDLPAFTAFGAKAAKTPMLVEHEKQMEKEHQASMAKLKSATGAALDQVFAAEMIKHHQKMLGMIKQAHLTDGKLKAVADKMAAEQTRELEELKKVK